MASFAFISLFFMFSLLDLIGSTKITIYHVNHPTLAVQTKTDVMLDRGVYTLSITVGVNPTVDVNLVFDTGSAMTWIQSARCKHCVVTPTPNKYIGSNDMVGIKCTNQMCTSEHVSGQYCTSRNECGYKQSYGDGSNSTGIMVSDLFNIYKNQTTPIPFKFGLGFDNFCLENGHSCQNGVSGFGAGKYTFPSQLNAKKWGFCLPSHESLPGFIVFNESAEIPVPYKTIDLDFHYWGVYLTTLTQIQVESNKIKANAYMFIDTGTSMTRLQPHIYDKLMDLIQFQIYFQYLAKPLQLESTSNLCYNSIYRIQIEIELDEDVVIKIEDFQVWYIYKPNIFCLAFQNDDERNILGAQHIVGYIIVYDMSLSTRTPALYVSEKPLTSMKECLL